MSNPGPIRVVQWTTGKVAREAIKAILDRPNLELIGAYAYSKEKAGQDIGDLTKLDRKLGIKATDDIDAIIALKPDCVVYMPLHPNIEHLECLLRAGINIASTASFMTGRGYGEEARQKLEAAAQAGKASLFGSGINPGWIDNLTAAATSLCRDVSQVRIVESFNIGLWSADANQDELGWGRPAADPGHAKDVEKATMPFGDAVEAIAALFKFKLDDVRCEVEFAHAAQDLDVPGRTVKKGTVAGIHANWIGVSQGHNVIEAIVQWVVDEDITPAWDISMAYRVEVKGMPHIKMRIEVLPEDMTVPMEELMTIGFMFPAMPVVNAIPDVVAARPGIVTYADLPPMTSMLRPKPLKKAEIPLAEKEDLPFAAPQAAAGASIEGKWDVVVKGPTGAQATELLIEKVDGKLAGTQTGQGVSSPIMDLSFDGTNIRWINLVTKPMKLKVEFNAVVEGGAMSGKCKAGFMGSYKFTGVKVQ
jgi:hypothetical protein